MKKHVNYILKAFVFLGAILFASGAGAQDKSEEVKQLIQSKHFTFRAQSALSSRLGTRQLTSDYDVRLAGDSMATYLPYFGRAYSIPYGTNEGGIRFNSTDFTYQVKERKKGGWEILMVPKDAGDVRQLLLSVTKAGYATLNVTSTNKEPISYNGVIISK